MAGPRTHIEMGALFLETYVLPERSVLADLTGVFHAPANQAAFYSGCVFPDWGYDGIQDDAAEDSHWVPFQEALIAYISDSFPAPWDEDTTRLIAFALGVGVHGITDDLWHFSRGDHRCFLNEAKARDNADHGPCETACDVFAHVRYPKRPMQGQFWWPTEVIMAVYERRDFTVNRGQLAQGFRKLEGEWLRGARWSWLAYPYYRRKFPWCHAHLQGDTHGAIAHGAAASVQRVQDLYVQF